MGSGRTWVSRRPLADICWSRVARGHGAALTQDLHLLGFAAEDQGGQVRGAGWLSTFGICSAFPNNLREGFGCAWEVAWLLRDLPAQQGSRHCPQLLPFQCTHTVRSAWGAGSGATVERLTLS